MRTWIILILLAAAAAVAFFVLSPGSEEPVPPPDDGRGGVATDDAGGAGGADPVLQAPPPEERPALEALPLGETVNVLFLAGLPGRVPVFLGRQWDSHPKIHVVSWVPPRADPGAGEGVPTPDVLPNPLGRRPGTTTLSDESVSVIAVHDMDPGALDDDFWIEVAKSVEEGRVGLLLMPGVLEGAKMVEHPVLRTLLPVDEVNKVAGDPPAGTFMGLAHFKVTEDGQRHPATRLVQWPTWSQRIWQSTRALETPWGTPFSYPVATLRNGAKTLVWAEPDRGDQIPAIIAGDPEQGRVLWVGIADFGDRLAYGRPSVVADWQLLVRNWIAWLGGQAE